ncbi:MAG: PKD domain-containing protein [Flavobacteriales bacterium]
MTDTICPGDEFYTIIQAERADEFQWDMKDGNKLQGSIIFHKYTTPGMHYFSVKISNSCGNELTVTDSIYVSNSYKTNLNSYAFDLLTNEACMGDNFTLLSFPYTNATFGLGDGNKANEKADTLINYMGMGDLEIGLTNFSYNALGSYTIIAMTENGCGCKDTLEVGTVEVVPSTKASAIISIDFYSESPYAIAYLNKPTSFYVGLTSNYFIDYGDGSTKTFSGGSYAIDKHIYKAEGTYTVSLIASNSCGESDSTGMIIKVIKDPKGYLSVKESSVETMSIEAFPNPTNDIVTFKFDRNMNETMLFSIYNLQGQLMHQQYISNANKVDFDFSAFSSGMYITSFVSETQNSSKRITLVK